MRREHTLTATATGAETVYSNVVSMNRSDLVALVVEVDGAAATITLETALDPSGPWFDTDITAEAVDGEVGMVGAGAVRTLGSEYRIKVEAAGALTATGSIVGWNS